MVPFHYMHGGWWFLPMIGFVVFMILACFLFRRVFHGGAFCCVGGVGGKNAASDDPVRILTSRYAKGEISREECERMKQEFEDVEDNFPAGYIAAETGEQVITVAGMKKYGSFGLLRSLAVSPDWRRMGIGKALTERLLALAWTFPLRPL